MCLSVLCQDNGSQERGQDNESASRILVELVVSQSVPFSFFRTDSGARVE